MDDAYKRRLEAIYKSHYERYLRYAAYLLHNPAQAEDMVHKAFLLAIENEEKSRQYPEAWIMKTLRNVCLNQIKQYAIRKPKDDAYIESQPVSEPSFDADSDAIMALKQELPEQDYQLLDQYCFQGKSVQEISESTGLSANTIHVRIHRIRKAAEKILFALAVIINLFQEI
ncbi:MAG: sigma-70 family RNA polymerase sigma factor [Clostridia bacterium]|nr:sigma-70 family RNA polymerase sigma factor [Clostridia bacterium]